MQETKTIVISLLIITTLGLLCNACGPHTPAAIAPAPSLQPPGKPPITSPSAQGLCGDGVCDGPENEQNCPQDCPLITAPSTDITPACLNPNPHRAAVSEELLEWLNYLYDGSFEDGTTEVVISDHPTGRLNRATVERIPAAARTGSYGYSFVADSNQGVNFSIKSYIEKGEDIRFSFWARSLEGEVSLQPAVYGIERQINAAPIELHPPGLTFSIGSDWTKVTFTIDNKDNLAYVLLSLEIGPNTTLHIDDVQVGIPIWRIAEYSGESRMVGGIPVPSEPVAPVHINFLIHIEDPSQIQVVEQYYQQKTAVFRELAQIFHSHGGFLTIQTEEDWVMAAMAFAPDALRELAEDYSVVYSTHTHGPRCRDDQGRPRSNVDCSENPDWESTVSDSDYEAVIEYVSNLRDLIAAVSVTPVTDHNGNWGFDQSSRFAEIPILTWSGYKDGATQRTYNILINNPWRPTQCSANQEIEKFLRHDSINDIIYIPGWGQAITKHPERVLTRLRPMISQFISYADPERINTFYAVLHVDHFYSREDNLDYIYYDEETGDLTYSAEFQQHLRYWDDMLTELIDPLVAEGYLQWTSLPKIGKLYVEWEEACGLR